MVSINVQKQHIRNNYAGITVFQTQKSAKLMSEMDLIEVEDHIELMEITPSSGKLTDLLFFKMLQSLKVTADIFSRIFTQISEYNG